MTPIRPIALPWWRYKMVWLVISGPAAVVVAGVATMVLALTHIDPVLDEPASPAARVAAAKTAAAPAQQARNHAATPTP
jgi:uncharacterized protein